MSSARPGWVRHVPPLPSQTRRSGKNLCYWQLPPAPPFFLPSFLLLLLPSFCPLSLHCPSSQCFSLFLLHHNSEIKASRGLWVLVPDYSSTSFGAVRRSHPPGLCLSMRFLISSRGPLLPWRRQDAEQSLRPPPKPLTLRRKAAPPKGTNQHGSSARCFVGMLHSCFKWKQEITCLDIRGQKKNFLHR